LAQQSLVARQESAELTRQRFAAGIASELDVRQAQSLVESARVSVSVLTRERARAHDALALRVGAPLEGLGPPKPLREAQVITTLPAGLPSDLLPRRPDIRAAEERLRGAAANIGAARAAFFPRISLTGTLGTASPDLMGLFGAGASVWSFIPNLV